MRMLFLFSLLATHALMAAGPLTHIFLAEEFLQHLQPCSCKESALFYQGTLFPDIRYIGEVTREETHISNVSFDTLLRAKSSFYAGMQLHAFIDLWREELIEQLGLYDKIRHLAAPYEATFLKILEDELLYQQKSLPKELPHAFSISDEELSIGISFTTLNRWNRILSFYCNQSPLETLCLLAYSKKGIFNVPHQIIAEWCDILPALAQAPEWQEHIQLLQTRFKEELRKLADLEMPLMLPQNPSLVCASTHETQEGIEKRFLDVMGNGKILLQAVDTNLDTQFELITSLLANNIGQSKQFPTVKAYLVPAHFPFCLKEDPKHISLIASRPAGSPLSLCSNLQLASHFPNEEERDYALSLIRHMTLHKDLIKIAALDTITGIKKRSIDTLYYDKENDTITALPEKAFQDDLGSLLARAFGRLLYYYVPTDTEKEALRLYRDHLAYLLGDLSPGTLCAQLDQLAETAGFHPPLFPNIKQTTDNKERCKARIKANCKGCQRLLEVLLATLD